MNYSSMEHPQLHCLIKTVETPSKKRGKEITNERGKNKNKNKRGIEHCIIVALEQK